MNDTELEFPLGAIVGLHLAGSNAKKTAMVTIRREKTIYRVEHLFSKIGSNSIQFSDERVAEIIANVCRSVEGQYVKIVVDCPLTLPPCIACQRPVCPGVSACDDISVACMLQANAQDERKGKHKLRPVNPQSYRLWDVMIGKKEFRKNFEPSFHGAMAPLVFRAIALQKRLSHLKYPLIFSETSVQLVLRKLAQDEKILALTGKNYRSFENGAEARRKLVMQLIGSSPVISDPHITASLASSVETFHAFLASWMGVKEACGESSEKPIGFPQDEGWVSLPQTFAPEI